MSIQPTWDDDTHTILRVIYEGDWTTAEFLAGFDDTKALIAGVDHPIVLILDLTQSGNPPPRFFTLINFIQRHEPQGVLQALVVRGNSPFNAILDVLFRLVPGARQKLHFVDSLEAAHQIAYSLLEQAVDSAQP